MNNIFLHLLLIIALVGVASCQRDSRDRRGERVPTPICEAGHQLNPVTGACVPIDGYDAGPTGGDDAGPIGSDDAGVEDDIDHGPNDCPAGQTRCAGACVNTQTSDAYCGSCSTACAAAEVCEAGACAAQSQDCREEPCRGFTYCDLGSGQCLPGCASTDQCGENELCDPSTRDCVCDEGYHLCSGSCVPSDSIETCGGRCSPCPGSGTGLSVCTEQECSILPYYSRAGAGASYSCAITEAGDLQCWGFDANDRTNPPQGQNYKEINLGPDHACALTNTGTVNCWGYNEFGQASDPAGTFRQISAGAYHSCGITTTGALECWGGEEQLDLPEPSGLYGHVSTGVHHTCAVTDSGSVECWGYDSWGEATPPEGNFIEVSAGYDHTCGL
ncbi:MAG: hypothetical protein ACNA8W_18350, partial [Bradymonadaceae bacterium]